MGGFVWGLCLRFLLVCWVLGLVVLGLGGVGGLFVVVGFVWICLGLLVFGMVVGLFGFVVCCFRNVCSVLGVV